MYNPLLLIDFYKATHKEQYPKGLTKMVSYYTPRMSRLKFIDNVTLFGLQGFIKEYLIKGFNEAFFNRSEEEVVAEYERVLNATLGVGAYESKKIRDLHRLGYLPIMISAVPEGTRTKIGVPQIEITNTHPNFVWLVNTIETMLSCTMWHTQIAAEVGYRYRGIVDTFKKLTCDDSVQSARLLGDFSMRGQQSVESAEKASAAWCLSFLNTATVPAILWLEDNYNCDCTKEPVAYGAISTEHSVMCSNFAVDGDEITHIKRLLTEVYPNHSFSMVSDSYDFWNLVTKLLPQCKGEIEAHEGYFAIRGDSGDPVEVIAGKEIDWLKPSDEEEKEKLFKDVTYTNRWLKDYFYGSEEEQTVYFNHDDKFYIVNSSLNWTSERGACTDRKYYYVEDYNFTWLEVKPNPEMMGLVWTLDQIFGHTVNSKGYKVLPKYVKALYGDSITPQRCQLIYERLMSQGYAINNVSLGVGSFSFMCLEEYDDEKPFYNPYTRDTFGVAVKATYAEDAEGKPIMIYKQPKALTWKKSQKGCCVVAPDGQSYSDEYSYNEMLEKEDNLIKPVFADGKMLKEYSLEEIRNRLYRGHFYD